MILIFKTFIAVYTFYNIPKDCGKSFKVPNIQEKIIGGVNAVPHSWPSIVGLFEQRFEGGTWDQFCGGTLIDNQTVLTAAQ